MREAHPLEQAVGMEYYVSDSDGVGGHLRHDFESFRVREIEAFDPDPIDSDPGSYPHVLCRVTLRGWDTNDFAGALSDRLKISRERISWAGTKDKHALTTQLFSVRSIDPEDLKDIELGGADFEILGRSGRSILFGDLVGNDFTIQISDPNHSKNHEQIIDELTEFAGREPEQSSTVGVPNYFGQQRFGSTRPVTHEIGLAIAREDYKGAVIAYVGNPHEREPKVTRQARAFVEKTERWEEGLERFPRELGYERAMLHSLVETGGEDSNEFRTALETAPSNLQRLFINAAQSYIFNRIVSKRLNRGLPFHEPIAGDIVCFVNSDSSEELPIPDTDRTQRVTEDKLPIIKRHCERGRAFVTAPLIGTKTDFANGQPGDIERAVLEAVGLEVGDFNLPGEFHSTGTRRAILLETALDVHSNESGLEVSFALPKGSYATVVLRELLKSDPVNL